MGNKKNVSFTSTFLDKQAISALQLVLSWGNNQTNLKFQFEVKTLTTTKLGPNKHVIHSFHNCILFI